MKPRFWVEPVAENRLHGDAVVHEHHAAGLGDDGFGRVEFDFDELHVVAMDLVVDDVHGGGEWRRLLEGTHGVMGVVERLGGSRA